MFAAQFDGNKKRRRTSISGEDSNLITLISRRVNEYAVVRQRVL